MVAMPQKKSYHSQPFDEMEITKITQFIFCSEKVTSVLFSTARPVERNIIGTGVDYIKQRRAPIYGVFPKLKCMIYLRPAHKMGFDMEQEPTYRKNSAFCLCATFNLFDTSFAQFFLKKFVISFLCYK